MLALTESELAEIVREPSARADAKPPPLIDAILSFEDTHVTEPVISCVL